MDKLLEKRFQMLLPEGHLVDLVQDCNKYDGKPLSKSQQKSIAKEAKNQEKAIEKLMKSAGGQGVDAYIASLEHQLEELKLS
jgi:hypothetical protein